MATILPICNELRGGTILWPVEIIFFLQHISLFFYH